MLDLLSQYCPYIYIEYIVQRVQDKKTWFILTGLNRHIYFISRYLMYDRFYLSLGKIQKTKFICESEDFHHDRSPTTHDNRKYSCGKIIDIRSVLSRIKRIKIKNNTEWQLFIKYFTSDCATQKLKYALMELKIDWVRGANIDIKSLPQTLTRLELPRNFNTPFNTRDMPSRLEHLKLGIDFIQPLSLLGLPKSLKSLKFSFNYPHPIDASQLPRQLERLKYCEKNLSNIKNLPFESLRYLKFDSHITEGKGDFSRFVNLQTLIFSRGTKVNIIIEKLPPSLLNLKLPNNFDDTLNKSRLPRNLHTLILGYQYNRWIDTNALPRSLKNLKFSSKFNQQIDINSLPPLLELLQFGTEFNQNIDCRDLPRELKILIMGKEFNPPTTHLICTKDLPRKLKHLDLGSRYNQPLDFGNLPRTLVSLKVGGQFNFPCDTKLLPPALEILDMGSSYEHSFNMHALPVGLKKLYLSDRCRDKHVGKVPKHILFYEIPYYVRFVD